ncbi:hypothetical protein [Caulobacter segnis]
MPLLNDTLAIVRAAKDRGWQFKVTQTTDSIEVKVWWDENARPPVPMDEGISQAFGRSEANG